MNTTYRNANLSKLTQIVALLLAEGFRVSPIIVPENEYISGAPYFCTNASRHDVMRAWKGAR